MKLNKTKKYQISFYLFLLFLFFNGCISSNKSIQKISFEENQITKDCSFDKYNCEDFATQKEAQQMFEKCGYDIHRLDRDKDGKACENS